MRVSKHLQDSGVYNGETPHGIRRGTIQAADAAGATVEQLQEFAKIKNPAVLRRYTDTTRRTRAPRGEPL